jgi:hypothetical protein
MCYLCNGIALVCVLSALILAPFWIRVVILVFILGEQLLKTHSPLAIVQQRHVDVVPPLDQPDASLQVDSTASPVVEPQCRYRGVSYTPSTKPAVER